MTAFLNIPLLRQFLRARTVALSVVAPTPTDLVATANGFTRVAGSFLTDGLLPGMEVLPVGFSDNTPGVITTVEAQSIVLKLPRAAEATGSGRSLVVGLPSHRAFENKEKTPLPGRCYIEEDLVTDNPSTVRGTFSGGVYEHTPMYVLRWYFVADTGTVGPETCVQALLDLFPPGSLTTLSNGDEVHVRGDIMPSRSKLNPDKPGWTVCTITIPLRAFTRSA